MIRFRSTVVFALSMSIAGSGCGVETYQQRIVSNTIPLFQYNQELDANLGAEWRKGEVRMRLPAGFKTIPDPEKDATVDRRLPPTLQGIPTGVLGGFRSTMQALSASGSTIETPIHIVVLSNRALLAAAEPETKPQNFDAMLLNVVSRAAGGGPVKTSVLKPVTVGGSGFEPSLRYEAAVFDASGGGVPMQYEVYIRRQPQPRGTPLQVAVVFLVPKEVMRAGPLRKQIELSLQTLRIEQAPTGAAPSNPASPPGGSGGSGPAF